LILLGNSSILFLDRLILLGKSSNFFLDRFILLDINSNLFRDFFLLDNSSKLVRLSGVFRTVLVRVASATLTISVFGSTTVAGVALGY
jgi:hypothetical protein